jgi:hypothetical protein
VQGSRKHCRAYSPAGILTTERSIPTLYVCSFPDAARTSAPGTVSITHFSPRWWNGPQYAPLVPTWNFRSVPRDRYEDLYAVQLASLDARKVVEDLVRLAKSEVVTILCHDHRRGGTFDQLWCHHFYAVSWFQHELGIVVRDWHGIDQRRPAP